MKNGRNRLRFLQVCENDDEGTIHENLTKVHEITRTNLVLISCGFVDRSLVFLFLEASRGTMPNSILIPSEASELVQLHTSKRTRNRKK
jgi:hypothetical protein